MHIAESLKSFIYRFILKQSVHFKMHMHYNNLEKWKCRNLCKGLIEVNLAKTKKL